MWIKKGHEASVEEVFLRNMEVSSLDDINEWFKKSYADGYKIDRLDEAVELALSFKDKKVTIVGDYDGDGITSTTILKLALTGAGFKDVSFRIPKRFSEGFGINDKIIDEISDGLIITCDNGVAQVDAIKRAKENGLTVIIIDHHLPVEDENGEAILPPADVIIDPQAIENSADFKEYCGAGLSWKFARKLLGKTALASKLIALSAIGTVTDVVSLREENYVIVRNGLKTLQNERDLTGLSALVSALGLSRCITAKDIGFKIGPTLNASSRMNDDGAKDAVELLSFTGPYETAIAMAERLVAVNEQRKEAKKLGVITAKARIDEECLYGDIPLVVYVPSTPEGIIGIIAGNLAEENHVPCIVVTDTEDGILKGSGRSYGNYHMKKELDKCSDLLVRYGGHSGAAGLSLKKENLDELRDRLNQNAADYEYEPPTDLYYDLEIQAKEIPHYIDELKKFEPFGYGNPEIVFKINGFSVTPRYGTFKKLMGADMSIVKLYSSNATAIGFDMAERMNTIDKPQNLDMIGTLSDNYFNGSVEHQIEFADFVNNEIQMKETPLAMKLKMMASSR